MSAIKILVGEHDVILRMIDVTRRLLADTTTVNIGHVEQILDFIKNFAEDLPTSRGRHPRSRRPIR